MTERYRQAWAEIGRANTGVYGPDDLIMISGSGLWGRTTLDLIRQVFETRAVPLIEKGVAAQSQFVVGYASGSDQMVRQYLLSRGYQEVGELAGYSIYTPGIQRQSASERITELLSQQVFVFGINTEGRHSLAVPLTAFGRGYARVRSTQRRWAIYGQARGLMQGRDGLSYGIETIDLRKGQGSVSLAEMEQQIGELLAFAESHPDLKFLVTAFGTGLASYQIEEVERLWQRKAIPPNVRLPQAWLDLL